MNAFISGSNNKFFSLCQALLDGTAVVGWTLKRTNTSNQAMSEEVEMDEKKGGAPPPTSSDALMEEPKQAGDGEERTSPAPGTRSISFTKSKRMSSKNKGRFSVKIAEPQDLSGGESGKESDEHSVSSPKERKSVLSTFITPMKGRFHVKALNEKPARHRLPSGENGEVGAGLETSFDVQVKNQMTVEAVPQLAYYRNQQTKSAIAKQRPTLKELHAPKVSDLSSVF